MIDGLVTGDRDDQGTILLRQQLSAILSGVADGIAGANPDGRVIFANQAAAELMGLRDVSEALGKTVQELWSSFELVDEAGEPVEPPSLPLRRTIESLQPERQLVCVRNQDSGDERWVIFKAQPVLNQQELLQMVILVMEDVTALKQAELERDAWMQTIAHDLKTPITAIRGYAQLAARNIEARNRHAALINLQHVVDGSDKLTNMVEQLGDLTRVQTRGGLQLQFTACNLADVARRMVEEARAITSKHSIRLDLVLEEITIDGDVERLERVLENLLSNAIKYSPDGGEVLVRVGLNEPGFAFVTVSDGGIGISKEDMSRIFDRFGRGANVGKITGSGIGLSFCQAVVQAHGGRLDIDSELAKGTRVTIRLPLEGAADPGSEAPAAENGWDKFHIPLT